MKRTGSTYGKSRPWPISAITTVARKLHTGRELLDTYRKVKGFYPDVHFRRIFKLYAHEKFRQNEILIWGLADPSLPEQQLSGYVSRMKLLKWIQPYVSTYYLALTIDKSVFYRLCERAGIAHPTLYGVYQQGIGIKKDGTLLKTPDDWADFFEPLKEFVIKPSTGLYGWGLRIFQRNGDGFNDQLGAHYTLPSLHNLMQSDKDWDAFVIQERLKNHPDLKRLCGSESLQTVRIITLIKPSTHEPQILHAILKVITKGNASDNFEYGKSGNLLSKVQIDSGMLEMTVAAQSHGFGLKQIHHHPETGVALDGVQLPFWTETCELVKRAAIEFLPIRTVGWDIAITATGPVIVEGNGGWDPLQNAFGDCQDLHEQLT